jgi:oxygen-independent coproporphyrinogen-3 oxidase
MIFALEQELILQRQYLKNYKIETIYFGGGTPSLLNEAEINLLLNTIYAHYNVTSDVELTLEANPDDLNLNFLKSLKGLGINRLSIGIQSFSDEVLKFLNRIHTGKEAYKSISYAREAGFNNISIDIIYGIPIKNHKEWEADLKTVEALIPEHISAYCLTIEPKTAFGAWVKKGKLIPVDDDFAALQFENLVSYFQARGYEQYEISNFCLPERYSKHNTNYWRQENYLGIGPGAHSFNGYSRQFNISHNIKYIKSIENGDIPFELDPLSSSDKINEYIMTSLRTRWGCDFNKIQNDYDFDIYQINMEYIDRLIALEYGMLENNVLFLSSKGKLLADKIASDLFSIME